ncbi:MAG TPA: UV DNA damage repair endonuclease UvsE [Oscillospiraceae bacterium]|nr:UV DNA damage repair endonuclease UvsE [Oscillospiraceae bacterium]HPK35958.1 UV DNA damage repair endonuclease UvsE [Oscillospiraceae bacterium]HPR76668.1 UV DNA damage repair endonuclease UvsE [Oscillospiraceae bacterium]
MNIGYACLAVAVPGSELKSCTLKNAQPERLLPLIAHNLNALETLIDYNIKNGIKLFRISSDLIPFGSSAAAKLPWQDLYADRFTAIGQKIRDSHLRVSMHPGQYTVLNSPDESVAERASQDLAYHAKLLDALGLDASHKIILHLGGAYDNKEQAKARFLSRFHQLDPKIKNRLLLENDDTVFNIKDVLETALAAQIPVVFDNLHHAVNPPEESRSDREWIRQCAATWHEKDGSPKIHYSQQNPQKKPGAHSDFIRIDPFLNFIRPLSDLDVDIMLEVKDKNRSALKCLNCISHRGIAALEAEWARYKYRILEHSPGHYQTARKLLQDKTAYPALPFYRLIEEALDLPIEPGNAANAAQHVWGYFKDKATQTEKKRFQILLQKYAAGESQLKSVKNHFLRLAEKYCENYLLEGYYLYQ